MNFMKIQEENWWDRDTIDSVKISNIILNIGKNLNLQDLQCVYGLKSLWFPGLYFTVKKDHMILIREKPTYKTQHDIE